MNDGNTILAAAGRRVRGKSKVRGRWIVALCMVAATVVVPFQHLTHRDNRAGALAAPGTPPVGVGAVRLPVRDVKLVNYVPATAGWSKLWTEYSHTRTDTDLQAIASLGANTVRLAVNAYAVGYPQVKPDQAAILKDFVATAKTHGLDVQLTLFDSFFNYSDYAGSLKWMHSLLDPYTATNTQFPLVEIHNEIPRDNNGALSWAKRMLDALPSILPGVPRTASYIGSTTSALSASNYSRVLESQDVIDVHLYGWVAQMTDRLATAVTEAHGRPVFVGEAGAPTGQEQSPAGDAGQLAQYANTYRICQLYGVKYFSPWNYVDLQQGTVPAAMEGTDELTYGLRRLDGTWKPAADFVRNMFGASAANGSLLALSKSPGVTLSDAAYSGDGSFEFESDGPIRADSLGSWVLVNGENAKSIGSVAGQGVNGSRAGFIKNSLGAASAPPSLMLPIVLPTPLTSMTASVMARGVGTTGTTWVSICWFEGTKFLGSTGSTAYTAGATSWQKLTVTSIRPTGANNAQIFLRTRNNTGTVYWDSLTVAS